MRKAILLILALVSLATALVSLPAVTADSCVTHCFTDNCGYTCCFEQCCGNRCIQLDCAAPPPCDV
jgi:hypothetical protein